MEISLKRRNTTLFIMHLNLLNFQWTTRKVRRMNEAKFFLHIYTLFHKQFEKFICKMQLFVFVVDVVDAKM